MILRLQILGNIKQISMTESEKCPFWYQEGPQDNHPMHIIIQNTQLGKHTPGSYGILHILVANADKNQNQIEHDARLILPSRY